MSNDGTGLRDVLRGLLEYVDAETCTHEETYRGGAIWTICRSCDRQWADDKGGFQPHKDAPAVAAARAALSAVAPPPVVEGQPVLWVNPDDLANPHFVGVATGKAEHEQTGKHFTMPLYASPAAPAQPPTGE